MAQPKQLTHRTVKNAALPYCPGQNPVSDKISYIAGSDLIAVIDSLTSEGWIERRPGWADEFETSATVFGAAPSRIFGWRKWNGAFYVMCCVVSGGTSTVYYYKIGTSTSFTSLFSNSSTEPFDFVVSGNYLYFSNDVNSKKWDGTTLTKWGIAAPTIITRGGYTGTSVGDWSYGCKFSTAFYNSVTGHLSSPSPVSTGNSGPSSSTASYSIVAQASSDTQVDEIWLLRSTDGGDGIFYKDGVTSNPAITTVGPAVGNSAAGGGVPTAGTLTPGGSYSGGTFPNYVVIIDTNGTPDKFKWSSDGGATYTTGVSITGAAQTLANGVTVTFSATTGFTIGDRWDFSNRRIGLTSGGDDSLLNTSIYSSAPSTINNAPPLIKGLVSYAGRIWGYLDDTLYFSGAEEVIYGVEEECFPATNKFVFSDEVMGIGLVDSGLLVFTGGKTFKITGDSIDTFRRAPLFMKIGCRQRAAITVMGKSLAWLDGSGSIRISDGFTQSEVSKHIRSDLAGIDHTQAAFTFHTDGRRNFLMLLDGGRSKVRVYDVDLDIWMPPWSVGGAAIASVETSVGTYTLLLSHTSKKVMKNTFASYADNGSTYTPTVTTQLSSITPDASAGSIADLEYFSLDTGSVVPPTVKILVDEDPSSGTFTDVTSNSATPALRTQGSTLKETWFYARSPAARRASLQMTWANSSVNFKLYGFDFASQELQK